MLLPLCGSYKKYLPLFFAAFLSMFIFQLVTRLTEYTFMFHQGVLLLASALVGASLSLVGFLLLSEPNRLRCVKTLPYLLLFSWLLYLLVFVSTQSLGIHFVLLSVVFGTLFLLITQNLYLTPNNFTGVELLGSFVGAGALVLLSAFVLEEWLVVIAVLAISFYIYYSGVWKQVWLVLNSTFFILVVVAVYIFSSYSLPELITCPDYTQTYKVACNTDSDTFTLDSSIASFNGRSDVFIDSGQSTPRLSVYKSGLHSGTSLHRSEYGDLSNHYHDVEIPPLAYKTGSKVAAAGASTGSNILTLQNYIAEADITLVEIDTIITDLYRTPAYIDFLPQSDSFELVHKDARTFFETSDSKFDVISMMVESVNTTLAPYTDESTSLVYTKQALQTYVESLTSDGYLLLQQFHTSGEQGDAMIHKVLGSLEAALPASAAAQLQENVLMYSYAFNPLPGAQRYLAIVYKPAGFTAEDNAIFTQWLEKNNQNDRGHGWGGAKATITALHTPDGVHTYQVYFDAEKRSTLASRHNTSIITDDKPFRHLVVQLPFPKQYYILILIVLTVLALFVATLFLRKRSLQQLQSPLLSVAFVLGLVTFGLQYVLYYKTAAFIGTNLIYFSVFLLIPLLFGAIGGYLSYKLTLAKAGILYGLSFGAAILLLLSPTFSLLPGIVLFLLLVVFVFSGTLFPLLLSQASKTEERLLLYAVNMGGGGAATLVVISLHATVGWTYLFIGLFAALSMFFGYLFYLFSNR